MTRMLSWFMFQSELGRGTVMSTRALLVNKISGYTLKAKPVCGRARSMIADFVVNSRKTVKPWIWSGRMDSKGPAMYKQFSKIIETVGLHFSWIQVNVSVNPHRTHPCGAISIFFSSVECWMKACTYVFLQISPFFRTHHEKGDMCEFFTYIRLFLLAHVGLNKTTNLVIHLNR